MYALHVDGGFVQHIALLTGEEDLFFEQDVTVWQMNPPLVVGLQSRQEAGKDSDKCKSHLIGFVPLDADDVASIRTWLAEVDKERRPQGLRRDVEQYIIHPPCEWVVDCITKVRRYRRFSCVGLILECYRDGAEIDLLAWDSPDLPEVTLDTIVSAYGNNLRNKASIRKALGIPGDGPWRVNLAGYVLHALDRSTEEIRALRHKPRSVDEARYPLPKVPL
jgi:hypothetical protein